MFSNRTPERKKRQIRLPLRFAFCAEVGRLFPGNELPERGGDSAEKIRLLNVQQMNTGVLYRGIHEKIQQAVRHFHLTIIKSEDDDRRKPSARKGGREKPNIVIMKNRGKVQ